MKWLPMRLIPVLVIASILFSACSAQVPVVSIAVAAPTATPELTATTAPSLTPTATATMLPPESDEVWDRIVANNKIVVGVSWDYPPFAYVDPNFQVVGFDIALIQEIGRRLDLPVDIQNFTFEGLPGALQLNQVDLAIASISMTPERMAQMSFSPVYYVNQTAILAQKGSQIRITDFKQLAGYRVGVRRGTVYEDMMQTAMIDSGMMHPEKLLSYMHADEAIRDLEANKLDLVVIGQATARYYSVEKGLEIVGKGFGQQDLAIAMRPYTPRLKSEIDRVMDDMLTDGTMLRLIQQYIQSDIPGVLPTPTSTNQPTFTPIPPVATAVPPRCVDGMKFISDVTFDDNDMQTPPYIKSGSEFVKTWRVENIGTCAWTPNYQLVYAYGNVAAAQMSGQPLNIPGNVAPGQSIDLSITLIAPAQQITYQGFWQMENAEGQRFGQTIWVGVTTLADPASPVATGQPSGNYCAVTLTTPTGPVTVLSSFDAVWTVKNISEENWSPDSVDYKFISGTEMHEKAVYDLPQTVKAGETVKIIVDMLGPTTPGIYNTKWAIVSGSKTICVLALTVTAIEK